PQFHFSPRRGWTNDPNGLVFYNGEYHLFYQHNPYGVRWNNMTWGHAASPDLLHWTEFGDAIEPDPLGTIFSGSAAVDWKNTTGFQKDPNGLPPFVCMFTYNGPNMRAGNPASQGLAYSVDGGKTFEKFEGNPTIPHIVGGNRDPKIFWREEEKRWVVALYMDGEDYALFASPDLKKWEKICDIKNLGCSECPDMFPLALDGNEDDVRWVFWGGNGKYLVGDFDGTTFAPQTTPLDAKWGGNDYAAQSYSDAPGRRIQFSWMSGGEYPGMPFNQQFTVPRELTLASTPEGPRLRVNPVEEVATLRDKRIEMSESADDDAKIFTATEPGPANYDYLDMRFTLKKATGDTKFDLEFRGRKISLDCAAGTITCEGVVAPLKVIDGRVELRVILDRTSIEVFANDGLSQIAKCFVPEDENAAPILRLVDRSPEPALPDFDVWTMKSVWK
ncbi:MAG: glycoside hydrolase family 32 protein, partial [Thermoguttaceae bacterium]|nr:glycoside hydrolase family 32 protein [Thermoguttaceae bacterium]